MQLGKSFDLSGSKTQDFRAKARSSHAEQKGVLESGLLYFGGKRSQSGAVRHLVIGDAKPAEPMILVGSGPKRGVGSPQTSHLVVLRPIRKRAVDGGRQSRRERVGNRIDLRCGFLTLPRSRGLQELCERVHELTQALVYKSAGHGFYRESG